MAKTLKAVEDEYEPIQGTIGSIPNEPGNGLPSHDEIRMAANEMVAWNEKRAALNAQIGGFRKELYGTDATPDGVKEQLKWRNIGFKDGVAGRGWANEAPKECPATSVQSYGEGHEEGQATVRRAFEVRLTATNAAAAEPAPDEDQIDIEDVANDTAAQDEAA